MRGRRIFLFACCLILLAACEYRPDGLTPIGDIIQDPGRFEGKTIKVEGEVSEVVKLPLSEYKSYVLHDDSGEILVTTAGSPPALHKKRAIKARVKAMAIFNHRGIGLHLTEVEQLATPGSGS